MPRVRLGGSETESSSRNVETVVLESCRYGGNSGSSFRRQVDLSRLDDANVFFDRLLALSFVFAGLVKIGVRAGVLQPQADADGEPCRPGTGGELPVKSRVVKMCNGVSADTTNLVLA